MIRAYLLALALAALLPGCTTVETTKGGAVGVDREQRMMVSSEEVDAGSRKAYAQMMAEAQKKGVLDRNPAQLQRVKAIVSKLVPQVAAFRADAQKWPWEVHVISVPEVNAWCMPGGKMAIYSGLIEKLNASDDEIAAVMGHEIAHALREHARERISRQMATQTAVGIAGALFGIGDLGQGLGNMVADVTLNLPNSRTHEVEADRMGVELAARAGYDPRAAIGLWEKMTKVSGGNQPPKWLSTHPQHEDRIKDLRAYSERVMPLYQASKGVGASAGK
ncbi:MAG TPA: M48 family metallopeptidase [Burkholderiales bacterium]|jgi:predicted Zn-dependent protease|nr:M48 family metallopeptidase [Burkholderiales bacterium]